MLANFKHRQLLVIMGTLILMAAIPATILLGKKVAEYFGRAQVPPPINQVICLPIPDKANFENHTCRSFNHPAPPTMVVNDLNVVIRGNLCFASNATYAEVLADQRFIFLSTDNAPTTGDAITGLIKGTDPGGLTVSNPDQSETMCRWSNSGYTNETNTLDYQLSIPIPTLTRALNVDELQPGECASLYLHMKGNGPNNTDNTEQYNIYGFSAADYAQNLKDILCKPVTVTFCDKSDSTCKDKNAIIRNNLGDPCINSTSCQPSLFVCDPISKTCKNRVDVPGAKGADCESLTDPSCSNTTGFACSLAQAACVPLAQAGANPGPICAGVSDAVSCIPPDFACEVSSKSCRDIRLIAPGNQGGDCLGIGGSEACNEVPEFICNMESHTCESFDVVDPDDSGPNCTGPGDNAKCQPVTPKYVCNAQTKACVVTSDPNDPRTSCTLNPGAGPTTPDTECDTVTPKYVCEQKACIPTTNPNDTRPTCVNNPTLVAQCIKKVCDTNLKTCTVEVDIGDPRPLCANDATCGGGTTKKVCDTTAKTCSITVASEDPRPACVNDVNCGGGTTKKVCDTTAKTCSITVATGDPRPACTNDASCGTVTAYHCEGSACVVGTGTTTCSGPNATCYQYCSNTTCISSATAPPAESKLCTQASDCSTPTTYYVCNEELRSCEPRYSPPGTGEVGCHAPNDPNREPNECKEVCDPATDPEHCTPPTGTAGVAVAVGILTLIFLVVGIRLVF
ncbi:hypothetical protein A3A70_02115 [candidate division WWE3 bacterium RIFCSPLOWO2_01_FULL_42_11]|uniref:Uncharacterized protein n=1 Tax=candidate division WWE3 bacterium RIFCSPLOWO2_01_FULL_42_11 TaxID=1802627 RepID=A0A1F4VRY2_UNCKA|nr:MAG: hypothetical protein A3A70_02115 [candidate division WWE3 bacterium RIFCSPLOWO2_01_FULL_42_11]